MKQKIVYALPLVIGMLVALCVPGIWAWLWRI